MKTVAVDTGGTFTDMVVLDHESGEVDVLKTPSTPAEPSEAILNGLRELFGAGLTPEDIASLTHGTTVVERPLGFLLIGHVISVNADTFV